MYEDVSIQEEKDMQLGTKKLNGVIGTMINSEIATIPLFTDVGRNGRTMVKHSTRKEERKQESEDQVIVTEALRVLDLSL